MLLNWNIFCDTLLYSSRPTILGYDKIHIYLTSNLPTRQKYSLLQQQNNVIEILLHISSNFTFFHINTFSKPTWIYMMLSIFSDPNSHIKIFSRQNWVLNSICGLKSTSAALWGRFLWDSYVRLFPECCSSFYLSREINTARFQLIHHNSNTCRIR